MKLGSLFDGSGGFPLAGALCGIEPIWASEIEPYPIAVTRSRLPKMKHLGDISKINGAEIEPVDIITFGSPCQDLSTAGKRAGLKHENNGDGETTRSGLFIEAVRIIKEMSERTNGKYPRFAVWENVLGAFSSNKGEDFRIVLEELIKITEPNAIVPEVPQKGWSYADSYCGDGWSLAYRVLDAQYWGVPQRRRRIYLVADFRGQRAREILFEREGLRGYFTKGRTPWQTTFTNAQRGIGSDDSTGVDIYNLALTGDKTCPLTAGGYGSTGTSPKVIAPIFNEHQPTRTAKVPEAVCTIGLSGANVSPTLISRMSSAVGTTQDNLIVSEKREKTSHIVRRLTPTESARLQGFADRWGDIDHKVEFSDEEYAFWLEVRNTYDAINGRQTKEYSKDQMLAWYNKLHTDSAEYKMWGNGIALPTALYVMQGIYDVTK